MYDSFACMSVHVLYACLWRSKEATDLLELNYRWLLATLWVVGTKPRSSATQKVPLTTELCLQPQKAIFYKQTQQIRLPGQLSLLLPRSLMGKVEPPNGRDYKEPPSHQQCLIGWGISMATKHRIQNKSP